MAQRYGPAAERPRFDTPNILWFFGAFVATGASDAVISDVHTSARGVWILLAALACLAAFAALAAGLLRLGWAVPGGVLATMAVTFVPVATGAIEKLLGVLPGRPSPLGPFQSFAGSLFALALVTAAAALAAFAIVRFHFMFALVAGATFVAAQLFLPALVTNPGAGDHATAFVVTGFALLGIGIALDGRAARRTAFWWHLDGLISLAIGLSYHAFRHASWGWVLIFVAGLLLLVLAASLERATWALFGVLGFFAPVAHYLDVWLGHLGVALAIAAVGIGLLALGIAARLFARPLPARFREAA